MGNRQESDGSNWNLKTVVAQAIGMQRVSSDLDKILDEYLDKGRTADEEKYTGEEFSGCLLSAPIIRALATELTLKAIRIKICGKYFQGHDLAMLFGKLDGGTRDLIEKKHKSSSKWSHMSVQSILNEHRNDFVGFRYLAEDPVARLSGEAADVSPYGADLQEVLCVLISTFKGLPD